MRRFRTGPKVLIPAILLGVAAFSGVIDLTQPPGPGLDPDALAYLGAATSLAHGHGLRVPSSSWESSDTTAPLVHFPPAFPVAIAAGIKAGATPLGAARLVEATSAAVTVVAMLLAADAAGGVLATVIVLGILASTPALIVVHGAILSEPLFLALLALFTWQMSRERRGADLSRTLILGALAAAATLTRYAGISLVAAVVAEAWWTVDGKWIDTWRLRAKRALVAAELPVLVLVVWMLMRPHSDGAEKIREVGLYTAGFGATLVGGLDTMARWLAPGVNSDTARAMAAIAVLAAIYVLVVRTIRAAHRGLVPASELRSYRATAIVLVSYLAVLFASRLLADPGIPLDNRMLAPVFLLISLRVAVAMASFLRASIVSHRGIALLTIGVTASWMWGAEEVSTSMIEDYRVDGGDLAGHEWSASPLIAWAAHAPPGAALYSNWPAAVWFHTARAAHELPSDLDPDTVRAFREKLAAEHGALLSFGVRAEDYAPPDSLAALAGLVAVERWPDGTVWRVPADTLKIKP
jgi:4-amino-4-deoxy-L-arabinose transferase-like glycosyltransferase